MKPLKIEIIVKEKIEDAKRLLEKVKRMSRLDMVLLGMAVVAYILLYSAVKDYFFEFLHILFNLEWYWYLAAFVVLVIKPALYLMKK